MRKILLIGYVLFLIACGGGGGSSSSISEVTPPPPATSAEGLWDGSTNLGQQISGVVLDDGTYYVLYTPAGVPSVIAGFVQGHGISNNGSFTSNDARDFVFGSGTLQATVSASYTKKQSLSGTITYVGDGTNTFTANYNNKYENQSKVSDIIGTFSGQVGTIAGVENANCTISDDGNLLGATASGCNLSGIVIPRSNCNVFNVSIVFGTGCTHEGQTVTGIACYDSSSKCIYIAMPNDARTEGYFFAGVKP